MKLYIYEHCPFCARVRYVAGMLNIPLEIINLAYDDDTTTNDLIGAKQVPLLIKHNGEVMAESLDIIAYFIELAQSSESHQPSESVLDWQKIAFLPLQKVGYPRWSNMVFPEFATQSAQLAWRAKKETEALNFDALLQDTPNIAKEVEALIERAKSVLNLDSYQHVTLVDEAILFSILRGFFSAAEILWDNAVKNWMESVSNKTHVPLLK
ncbi:GrxB family glutaredoxin [Vibrio fluvialis]|uniref:GrxB family glutaredoxin n=1 Tax=Vibrio fluvialis TaxID=676 RepID=UPI001F2D41AF|nr:GrxB family glutaredoxin [Vibrio fluvialis]EKO3371181.1 GrxB family glutaredoxin [Vibrio fluvialis]ELE5026114.1 GrxB family glutaredoxin [Vibrio fluvialis]MCE7611156.1 GrxB family glutaredoxin [Vibrio fluvialis]MCE7621862.1 GrxB family glutaredoxin [Vibrio fluvialis]MCE7627761.1 GrxB family glutaredoxin [Vibrio fluvialis]